MERRDETRKEWGKENDSPQAQRPQTCQHSPTSMSNGRSEVNDLAHQQGVRELECQCCQHVQCVLKYIEVHL